MTSLTGEPQPEGVLSYSGGAPDSFFGAPRDGALCQRTFSKGFVHGTNYRW